MLNPLSLGIVPGGVNVPNVGSGGQSELHFAALLVATCQHGALAASGFRFKFRRATVDNCSRTCPGAHFSRAERMTKRQLIRAGFILAGALILNGCGQAGTAPLTGTSPATPAGMHVAQVR